MFERRKAIETVYSMAFLHLICLRSKRLITIGRRVLISINGRNHIPMWNSQPSEIETDSNTIRENKIKHIFLSIFTSLRLFK